MMWKAWCCLFHHCFISPHNKGRLDAHGLAGHYDQRWFLSSGGPMQSNDNFPLEKLTESPPRAAGRPSYSTNEDVSFLRLPEVKSVTGLSKSSLYALIRANSFPAPIQLGPRTVAWVRSEIKQWAAERIEASRAADPSPGDRRPPKRATTAWPAAKKWA